MWNYDRSWIWLLWWLWGFCFEWEPIVQINISHIYNYTRSLLLPKLFLNQSILIPLKSKSSIFDCDQQYNCDHVTPSVRLSVYLFSFFLKYDNYCSSQLLVDDFKVCHLISDLWSLNITLKLLSWSFTIYNFCMYYCNCQIVFTLLQFTFFLGAIVINNFFLLQMQKILSCKNNIKINSDIIYNYIHNTL